MNEIITLDEMGFVLVEAAKRLTAEQRRRA
jgi:hypothetical protein